MSTTKPSGSAPCPCGATSPKGKPIRYKDHCGRKEAAPPPAPAPVPKDEGPEVLCDCGAPARRHHGGEFSSDLGHKVQRAFGKVTGASLFKCTSCGKVLMRSAVL